MRLILYLQISIIFEEIWLDWRIKQGFTVLDFQVGSFVYSMYMANVSDVQVIIDGKHVQSH